jgi:hypothetical protein
MVGRLSPLIAIDEGSAKMSQGRGWVPVDALEKVED